MRFGFRLQPPRDRRRTPAQVQSRLHPAGVGTGDLSQQPGIAHRGGPHHHACRPDVQPVPGGRLVTDAAGDLDREPRFLHHPTDQGFLGRRPPRGVEVDQVQHLRARRLVPARQGERIVAVAGLLTEVASPQPDHPTAAQIEGRDQFQPHHLTPGFA